MNSNSKHRIVRAGARFHIHARQSHIHTREYKKGIKWDMPPKRYVRMEQLALPEPHACNATLDATIRNRASQYELAHTALSREHLATLLGLAMGIREGTHERKRMYPSGGELYPVEAYIFPYNVSDVPRTIAHYAPREHALELLWELGVGQDKVWLLEEEWAEPAPLVIFFTARWDVNEHKYESFSYPLALIEAGHIAQNMALIATSLGLTAIPNMGFDAIRAQEVLDVDPARETAVYSLVVGHGHGTNRNDV